jgi:3D (Asp-Asp-Asp) domain-containing protein
MNASAYSHTGRNTASGIYPYKGAVAVDPRVIPIGTRLYIEGYGYAKALDVGSAVKGNKIDLFFETESQARRWGRRPVKVYVLE